MEDGDECHYLGEYTARKGYAHSETNNLILNLKKSVACKGTAQWPHKQAAIARCGAVLRNAINPDWLKHATLVPVPPSKAKNDKLYDDRMLQVLRAVSGKDGYDVRELVIQRRTTVADHEGEQRRTPAEIAAHYVIDEALAEPAPKLIGVVDDVLTKGSHFKAMQMVLGARFPGVRIVGIFIARRAPEADDLNIQILLDGVPIG